MNNQVYYKNIELTLFDIGGWKVAAESAEVALNMAHKRSTHWQESDVKEIGNVTVNLGTADNYNDILNIKEKLKVL